MNTVERSIVKDMSLAREGHLKIDWVRAHMPVLNRIREQFEKELPFQGLKVVISLHLEAKTAYLAKVIKAGGAEVAITGSNPLSTQDDVCAALVEDGITVYAKYNPEPAEYKSLLMKTLETKPDLIIDDGGDLISILHSERQDLLEGIRGGAEETTTGILRLKAMEKEGQLQFPMVAVNDAYCKYLFDNRYGTGQSVFDGINRTTNLVVAGKTVVVAGYGWCGKGVAMRAKGLGAQVVVTEVDAIKAVEAYMDGFTVLPMKEAAKIGDYFITVTGNRDIITREDYEVMKEGAILSNAGHFDVEVNKEDLEALASSKRTVRKNIEEYQLKNGKKVYLLAEGRLVNLAAGDGHPAEIMDMTFALQAMGLKYINEHYKEIGGKVINVPYEIDEKVARMKLESLGISLDSLSEAQKQYLDSWKEE
ncbi:adenosylhomocysteinase [Paenibacillus larvae]|uniref:Adenosylhomocysteinase n=3 Tax=Paenibacillus larvae TaxID=1464 RepID=V9W812_9BACL|nr:adenosylhomocysteinase [Paenibacillus larvae]AHD06268.1 adenosylhomocysteinase AhcY [Paenibacillus larvae subsp. larvae DSM 25430]AQR77334.1 adenosylhomocysteinase [Paenibacillus larvae subsp. larvae]AVF21665.1 adenosylhomocysteinase AhcY [Paenibacillus larvae subsp. larvae]AVG12806.1 adenosylhomocysteinase AhcY [Paenibacillus larvae subsp. larvae DSM 25430]ETK27642.1 adenosylhomocysteinase AhcY [Paenibacillus larvae subsp. larvae DSM 25719]